MVKIGDEYKSCIDLKKLQRKSQKGLEHIWIQEEMKHQIFQHQTHSEEISTTVGVKKHK